MGPLVTREHRDRVRVVRRRRRRGEGATLVVDGRDTRSTATASSSAPSLLDHVTPGMASTTTRSSGRCSAWCASPTYDDARRARERQPVRERRGDLHPRRRCGAAVRARGRRGMVGVNVPIPVPVAYYSFGGWKQSLFGDTHMYGPEGVHFYTRAKVVTTPLARPGDERASTSASPNTANPLFGRQRSPGDGGLRGHCNSSVGQRSGLTRSGGCEMARRWRRMIPEVRREVMRLAAQGRTIGRSWTSWTCRWVRSPQCCGRWVG